MTLAYDKLVGDVILAASRRAGAVASFDDMHTSVDTLVALFEAEWAARARLLAHLLVDDVEPAEAVERALGDMLVPA